jgi:hypothetical protein
MLGEHRHRVVDEVCDVPRALLGDEPAARAGRHVRGAHREMLLALRAVVDGALSYFDEKPGGEPLVRVEVEGESESRAERLTAACRRGTRAPPPATPTNRLPDGTVVQKRRRKP